MTANVNLPKNDCKKLCGTTPCCLGKSVKKETQHMGEEQKFSHAAVMAEQMSAVSFYTVHMPGLKKGLPIKGLRSGK